MKQSTFFIRSFICLSLFLLVTSILSFNLGEEPGQITIILLVFGLIISRFGKKVWYMQRIVYPLSICIALIAAYWIYERMTAII